MPDDLANRDVNVTEFTIYKANNNRTRDELRQSITKRVGGQYLPRAISNETRVNIIKSLDPEPVYNSILESKNHIQLRKWIGDICGFDYDYTKENCTRAYTLNRNELQHIDYMLDKHDIDGDFEINTENPKRVERM